MSQVHTLGAQTLTQVDVTRMASGLMADYIYSVRSAMATEACSKRPRQWILEGLMTDSIRNLQQAQIMVNAKGKIIQPGPFDTVAQQLDEEPKEDPLVKILAHIERTDKTVNYLKRELRTIKDALPK